VHDEEAEDPYLAYMLSRMFWPEFPVPVGVFRKTSRPTHDQLLMGQIQDAKTRQGEGDLQKLLLSGETWVVEAGASSR
jgi:2-oxoglutarate/2-oxoacid ferredoxin oxidoreductase subunit beta